MLTVKLLFLLTSLFTYDRETQEVRCCVKQITECFSLGSSAGEMVVPSKINQVSTQRLPITTPGLQNKQACKVSLKASCTRRKDSCVQHSEASHILLDNSGCHAGGLKRW